MITMTPRDRAILSYALALAAMLTTWTVVFHGPVLQRAAFFDSLSAHRIRYKRFQEAVAAHGTTAANDRLDRSRLSEEEQFLQGETDALALAQLEKRLGELIDAHDARLLSITVRSAEENLPLPAITVRVELTTSAQALTGILHGLQYGRPDLFVDNLFIEHAGPDAEAHDALSVRLEITGFRYPEAS